jgi:predicted acetylornithine/succinylornithine family transaminase
MGAAFERARELDATYVMKTYARKPVLFVRGEGMRLYDDEGREYLDFVSGIGAVNLGHAHPAVTAAVSAQMARLVHASNLFYVEQRAELAESLARLAGGGVWRTFFANSGAEAVEGAIKLARRYGTRGEGVRRTAIVTAERSFHGRTLAALAATGQPSKQEAFEPLPVGFTHVPLNDLDALAAAVMGDVCAVMLEPVQGEGGVFPCTEEYLRGARAICDERGALLIFDEVQTGFFRTGPAFAWQGYGVEPDVFTLAKGIANGLPAGAIVARDDVASAFAVGDHGSTFGGGPVLAAAALATIAGLEAERCGERAAVSGEYLRDRLRALEAATGAITDVRGRGLMVGVTVSASRAAEIAAGALARGVVINAIGDSILRFLPPLVCSTAEIDTLLNVLSQTFEEM